MFLLVCCYLVAFAVAELDIRFDPAIKYRFNLKDDYHVKMYETFPPIDDIVIQTFHFKTNTPLILDLQDAFCTGHDYEVYDNFQLIGKGEDILNFCGISVDTLKPIINPSFLNVKFLLDAGEHFLAVVIFQSPIGSKRTSMRITLMPIGNEACQVSVMGMEEKGFPYPTPNFKPSDFNLEDYMKKSLVLSLATGHLIEPEDSIYN